MNFFNIIDVVCVTAYILWTTKHPQEMYVWLWRVLVFRILIQLLALRAVNEDNDIIYVQGFETERPVPTVLFVICVVVGITTRWSVILASNLRLW